MAEQVVNWAGDDWQEHVLLLLKRHYGPGWFQEIPDQDRGDCGLEGFSHDGCAYQCYAAQEPLSIEDLVTNQKRKITRDIKKFCDNAGDLKKFFGPLLIGCWVFVVPRFPSKEVIKHGEKKAEEVRSLKLSIAKSDFCVRIITDDVFAVERKLIYETGLKKIKVNGEQVPHKEIEKWSTSKTPLVAKLDQKIQKVKPVASADQKAAWRSEMIRHYITGQNVISKLNHNYSDLYEAVLRCKDEQEQFLAVECMTATGLPAQTLRDTIGKYEGTLVKRVPGIDEHTARLLAMEAVSDWLLRCPLDF